MAARLLLVDTAGLFFRAFYGMPESDGRTGMPVNAIRGTCDMFASLVQRFEPTELVACWDDDWRPEFRTRLLPSYKSHRVADAATNTEEIPPGLVGQIPLIAALLDAIGVVRVGRPGFEADDVIGTIAAASHGRLPVDIVTGDRDLFQLVDDAQAVRVVYVAKGGVRDPEFVDQGVLEAKYGVAHGGAYAELAVLRGDPSDGLPGVAGVGEKTAAALLRQFGDLTGVLAALDGGDPAVKGALRTRLTAARDYLDVAPQVVRVRRDVPVPAPPYAVPRVLADPETVQDLAEHTGVESSVGRLVHALGLDR